MIESADRRDEDFRQRQRDALAQGVVCGEQLAPLAGVGAGFGIDVGWGGETAAHQPVPAVAAGRQG
jgi:hypothetical protein